MQSFIKTRDYKALELRSLYKNITLSIIIILVGWSCSSSKSTAFDKSTSPNALNCNVIFEGFDKGLRKERKELGLEYFFGFTTPKLKPVLKDRDFVECTGNLTRLDKDIYLRLNIQISAPNATATYGLIPKGNIMVIDLIEGEKIYSYSAATSKGSYNKQTKKTVYDALYLIENVKELSSKEIDKLGIMWTSGFEEYPIYEVDFLMRQLKCLGN